LEEFAEELLLCLLATEVVEADSVGCQASGGNGNELGREDDDVGGCGVVRGEGELLCDVITVSWWGSLDCLLW